MKRIAIRFACPALLLALAISGCMLGGSVSIQQRIDSFIDGLNTSDRLTVYTNFSPTETQDYGPIASGTYWDSPFPVRAATDPLYAATITDSTNPLAVLVTINGGAATFFGPKSFQFVMVNEPSTPGLDNWLIHEIWADDGAGGWTVLVQ